MAELPPGQRARADQPPFGLPWYGHRMPAGDGPVAVQVGGIVGAPFVFGADDLALLRRRSQTSDFHCVTTWSRTSQWGGVPFRTVYEQLIVPRVPPSVQVARVGFVGADGYRDSLPLSDLLRDEVLLADELDGAPLPRGNGAPLWLVAPAHYGYKNIKYLVAIELLGPARGRCRLPSVHHPRARVELEERLLGLPGRRVRYLYRLLIPIVSWWFRRMMSR